LKKIFGKTLRLFFCIVNCLNLPKMGKLLRSTFAKSSLVNYNFCMKLLTSQSFFIIPQQAVSSFLFKNVFNETQSCICPKTTEIVDNKVIKNKLNKRSFILILFYFFI